MSTLSLKIKHSGKTYEVPSVDLAQPGKVFKDQIYALTGVEPSKVKVVVKGGMLKDDADMSKLGLKEGATLMVIGPAGPLPQAPTEKVVFMEDMTDQELAKVAKLPGGLTNLGNTCYLNSTIQVLRAIPELQSSLNTYRPPAPQIQQPQEVALTNSLRDLYKDMSSTTEGFAPFSFLNNLRKINPQFAERSRTNNQFAQQDAQEAWGTILQAVKSGLEVGGGVGMGVAGVGSGVGASASASGGGKFVERFLEVELTKTLKSVEAPDEAPTVTKEILKDIKCNISATTNYMMSGITESLEQSIEKHSPTLNRSLIYQETSRISRLPSYLTINMVRFFWRRDINKKAKIMRKVKFPFDLDVMDLVTDDLKKKLRPVNEKLQEVGKDRRERAKIRKRVKGAQESRKREEEEKAKNSSMGMGTGMVVDGEADPEEVTLTPEDDLKGKEAEKEAREAEVLDGELVDEPTKRDEEKALLMSLVDPELEKDVGGNVTGLYELVAVVTHKGPSADGGHYVGWSRVDRTTTVDELEDPDKAEWYLFDDDKVSTVTRDKIALLDGGGEAHSAYILLYASKKF